MSILTFFFHIILSHKLKRNSSLFFSPRLSVFIIKWNNRVILENNRLGQGSKGPPRPLVGPGQSPGGAPEGESPPWPKTNLFIFTCLRKALHESSLFIFIIQKSCQILEIIDFSKNKKQEGHDGPGSLTCVIFPTIEFYIFVPLVPTCDLRVGPVLTTKESYE